MVIKITTYQSKLNKIYTYGATISAAATKSSTLLAANWTMRGLSPVKENHEKLLFLFLMLLVSLLSNVKCVDTMEISWWKNMIRTI